MSSTAPLDRDLLLVPFGGPAGDVGLFLCLEAGVERARELVGLIELARGGVLGDRQAGEGAYFGFESVEQAPLYQRPVAPEAGPSAQLEVAYEEAFEHHEVARLSPDLMDEARAEGLEPLDTFRLGLHVTREAVHWRIAARQGLEGESWPLRYADALESLLRVCPEDEVRRWFRRLVAASPRDGARVAAEGSDCFYGEHAVRAIAPLLDRAALRPLLEADEDGVREGALTALGRTAEEGGRSR